MDYMNHYAPSFWIHPGLARHTPLQGSVLSAGLDSSSDYARALLMGRTPCNLTRSLVLTGPQLLILP